MEKQETVFIKLSELGVSPTNPRKYYNPEKLGELAESIIKHGVIQAITVRRMEPVKNAKKNTEFFPYEIISGERRVRASKIAKKEDIPCTIREFTDQEAMEIQFVENLQREDLSPMEEAD